MNKTTTALLLLAMLPAWLWAQADTARAERLADGNWFSDSSKFDYQPAPLYGHNWLVMSQLLAQNWQTRTNEGLRFPANGQAVALRFFVKNDAPEPRELVLEIDDQQMDRAKIWLLRADGSVDSSRMSGDKMPFQNRDIAFANANFRLRFAAGETAAVVAYLDQSGLYLRPRFALWLPDKFAAHIARRQAGAGAVMGIFGLSALVFSLMAAFDISPVTKWYAAFLCLQTLQLANVFGIGHQFLWPQSGLLSSLLNIVLPSIGFIVLFQMMSVFLGLRARVPRWHRGLWVAVLCMVGYIALGYGLHALGFERIAPKIYAFGMFLGVTVLALAVACCLRVWSLFREKKGLLFLLAFSCGLAGVAISWLAKAGAPLPYGIERYGLAVGFLLDMGIFNFLISKDLWQTKAQNHALQLHLAQAAQEATANLLRGEEAERERLSMALHDGVGIELGSIRRRLERHFEQLNGQASHEARQTMADLDNVAEQIRAFSHALDPFSVKSLRLPELLDNLLFDFESACPEVAVCFSKSGFQNLENQAIASLSENEKHLFFIAAELLNNVARHARAAHVWLLLENFPGKIALEIADDGTGYDPANTPEGVGLSHIRSRAQLSGARFWAAPRPGGGMTHRVEMPVAEQALPPGKKRSPIARQKPLTVLP